jgi:hypothetical protein
VKDKKPTPPTPVMSKAPAPSAMSAGDDADEAALEDEPPAGAMPGAGSVTVEVSRLAKPGAIVSGSVTFSDGVTATWSLDQFGRLGLAPAKQGYRPSEADVGAFQLELRRVLSAKGF